jgi:hypothetical protein
MSVGCGLTMNSSRTNVPSKFVEQEPKIFENGVFSHFGSLAAGYAVEKGEEQGGKRVEGGTATHGANLGLNRVRNTDGDKFTLFIAGNIMR